MSTFITIFFWLLVISYLIAMTRTHDRQLRELKEELLKARQANRKLYRLRNVILAHKKK